MRLSMQRLTRRPLGNSRTPAASTPGSPIRTRASASARFLGTDVDPQILHLGDLLPVVLLHEVDRALPDHTE